MLTENRHIEKDRPNADYIRTSLINLNKHRTIDEPVMN